jgi:hypothetical protein
MDQFRQSAPGLPLPILMASSRAQLCDNPSTSTNVKTSKKNGTQEETIEGNSTIVLSTRNTIHSMR